MSVTESSASWTLPVLGDACRQGRAVYASRRSVSASAALGTRKPAVVRLPRAPRPARTLQIFNCAKKGLQDCMRITDDEIRRLRAGDLASPCQSRLVEVEKQIKQAERQRKRLEFHLFKLEELEDSYILHQQLREGVKTMAKAYNSHPGSSKKMSMHNVERGHKECVRTLCLIEAQLESLLGAFQCTMAGLAGFARLVPGDTCEMLVKYGSQKWKCRGKIGDNCQTWDPKTVCLKALVGDEFSIKLVEVKSLSKNVIIGEKTCETKDMFSAQSQSHTVSMNASGSVRLTLLTSWLPMDGVDEVLASVDVPRRLLATPRKQMMPVRSMIEGDSEQLLYWQRHYQKYAPGGDSLSKISLYSAPAFQSSLPSDIETPDRNHHLYHQHGVSHTSDTRPAQSRLRPHSMFDSRTANDADISSPLLTDTAAMMRSLSMESLLPRLLQRTSRSIDCILMDLRTTVEKYRAEFSELTALTDQLDRLADMMKSNAEPARRLSDESNSIETVLEAFSFLESVDYECDPADITNCDESLDDCAHSTMNTTDSGIGSIANRPAGERRSRSDSRLLATRGVMSPELPTAAVGVGQLDVALQWHVRYCQSLSKNMCAIEHQTSVVAELQQQAVVLQQLLDIADDKDIQFNNLPCVHSADSNLVEFWTECCDQYLYCLADTFISTLGQRCAFKHNDTVYQEVLSRIVGSRLLRNVVDCDEEFGFLSQTVTLHQYLLFFQSAARTNVEQFVDHIATQCEKTSKLLPDVLRKA